MNLTCEHCGGPLEVQSGGMTVLCRSCGNMYTMDQLRAKLKQPRQNPVKKANPETDKPVRKTLAKTTKPAADKPVRKEAQEQQAATGKPPRYVGILLVIVALVAFFDGLLVEDPVLQLVIFIVCGFVAGCVIFSASQKGKNQKKR